MTIWKQQFTLEGINAMCDQGLGAHLGIKYTNYGPDYLEATMPVTSNHIQPMGLLHGGATASLAESIGSIASVLCCEGSNMSAVGVELNINHLRSATDGHVRAICRPVKVGRTIHVWNIEIFDEMDRQISVSRLTTMVKTM